MYPVKRILVPTDFSLCAEVALHKSLRLARQYEAEVHVLHVAEKPSVYARKRPEDSRKTPLDEQRIDAWLAGVVENSTRGHDGSKPCQPVLPRRAVVAHPDPVTAIGAYVREQAIDLVVMGTHGDRAAERFLSRGSGSLLGRTAEQVVRYAPCPVLTVGLCHRKFNQVSQVLVPVDLSSLSALALTYARDMAAVYGAHLVLLHVIEAPGAHYWETPPEGTDLETQARAELIKVFEQTKGPAVSAGFHVATGRPDQEIRRFVRQEGIDLIVQGAHSGGGRETLGVVAEEIVRSVLCPVLTVRGVEESMALSLPAAATGTGPLVTGPN